MDMFSLSDLTKDLFHEQDLFHEEEARAIAILKDTGFKEYLGDLESNEAWRALNVAIAAAHDPFSPGIRAERARSCLLLIRLARAAQLEGDTDDLPRYSLSLGRLDCELLSHMECKTVIEPRWRKQGLEAALKTRSQQREDRWAEWAPEAARYRAHHPDDSEFAVAKHVAEVCGAKPETVRKALRRMRQEAEAVDPPKK